MPPSTPATPSIQSASQVLDRHFLEMRCTLLDLAAALDRIERSDGWRDAKSDPRYAQLQQGISLLLAHGDNRAEKIQMLFSDNYVEGWNRT